MQLAEFTGDLIGLCGPDGQLEYLNSAGQQLVGIDKADIFPTRLTDYVVPEQRYLIDAEVVPTARERGVWEGEMQLLNAATGSVIDVQRSTYVRRDEAGEIVGFVSVMRDITAQKAEDLRLRRQVATFEALIANNPFGVYLIDASFTLRVVSKGAERVFETIDPLIGRDFTEVIRCLWPEPFASEVIGHFRHALETGDPYAAPATVEERAGTAARESYDWRIERVVMPDESFGVVCYFYDLTERETWTRTLSEREEQLRELTVDLERRVRARTAALNQANERLSAEIERRETVQVAQLQSQKLEALGQLTSGIAHDFNNVLGAVIGGFAIIANRSSDSRIQQIVSMGQRAAERGAALVRQLLAFARLQDIVPEAVDMPAAVGEIADLLLHGGRGGMIVTSSFDKGSWPVLADPTQLQSALLNLAHNASDATGGAGHLKIHIGNCPAVAPDHPIELAGHDAVRIDVTDNGPGIDGPTLQRITEPFFTTKAPGKGTGLGLAMVKRFIEQSSGALRIESSVGRGTTFSLFLPRADEAEPTDRAATGDERDAPSARAFETVVLVDDDSELCAILAAGLTDGGFDVLTASDGQAALKLLATHAVDVVVSDIDMPRMSGIELIGQVRAERPQIACLLMTGNARDTVAAGEVLLEKPFDALRLQGAIRQALVECERRATDFDRINRLGLRLKSDCAVSLFRHWQAVRDNGNVPRFANFELAQCSEPNRIVVAEVNLGKVPIDFTFTAVGDSLRDAYRQVSVEPVLAVSGDDTLAAREAAYRRCALTGRPSYEFARIDLGEERIETFERLLLPFSSDGTTVDRIVGAVIIDQAPAGGEP
jgi:PAS domain S-box-containing protein